MLSVSKPSWCSFQMKAEVILTTIPGQRQALRDMQGLLTLPILPECQMQQPEKDALEALIIAPVGSRVNMIQHAKLHPHLDRTKADHGRKAAKGIFAQCFTQGRQHML